MNLKVVSKDVVLTNSMNDYLNDKLSFLNKFLHENTIVKVKIVVEKSNHIVTVIFPYETKTINLTSKSNNFYSSIDLLVKKLKNDISKKHKLKYSKRKNRNKYKKNNINTLKEINISLSNECLFKPMSEQEAYLQMKLTNKDYFLFCNSDMFFNICLIYKNLDTIYKIADSINDL